MNMWWWKKCPLNYLCASSSFDVFNHAEAHLWMQTITNYALCKCWERNPISLCPPCVWHVFEDSQGVSESVSALCVLHWYVRSWRMTLLIRKACHCMLFRKDLWPQIAFGLFLISVQIMFCDLQFQSEICFGGRTIVFIYIRCLTRNNIL